MSMAQPVEARKLVRSIRAVLERSLRDRPYRVLALAAVAGYVAGGGLFSRLTRPLARAAMGTLLAPAVRERLLGGSRELGRMIAGAA